MAEETDLSRTEPASPRRLQEARRKGDVPRSSEFSAWLVLAAVLGALSWQATPLLHAMQGLFRTAFAGAPRSSYIILSEPMQALSWALLPVFAAGFVAALAAPLLLSGWTYSLPRAVPGRAHPSRPLSRLLSAQAWFDTLLVLLKLLAAGAAVWWMLENAGPELLATEPDTALRTAAHWIGRGMLVLIAALALVSALDAAWRWWRYLRRHAMTYQEVLAEAREAELPAEMRAQLQARQQQAGQGARASAHERPVAADRGATHGATGETAE